MKTPVLIFFLLFLSFALGAQTEEEESLPIQTFTTYRLVNGQTAETLWKKDLLLTFSHRFTQPVTDGISSFFGLDAYADIRFGFGYGITDRLAVEVGRTRTGQTYDGGLKLKLLQQSPKGTPVTFTLLSQTVVRTADQENDLSFKHRLSFVQQAFLARKFNDRVALQLMPVWVHHNLAEQRNEKNDTWLMGAGGRVQVTRVINLSLEYYHPLNNTKRADETLKPVVGLGVDFLTRRHAFQLTLSNSAQLLDNRYLTETTGDFFDKKGLLIGFHVTRLFLTGQ